MLDPPPAYSDGGRPALRHSGVSGNAKIDQLRAELTKAEEELRRATTPEAKLQTIDRLRQTLAELSCEVLSCKPNREAQFDKSRVDLAS